MLRGKGPGMAWLKAHVSYSGEDCLIWPQSRNHQGYGQVGLNGKVHKAHRIMCALAHGEPPAENFEAAHSCGKGHAGCVHPGHLSWKTPLENRLEANEHGTGRGKRGKQLDPEVVRQIKESPKSYLELADEFGVYFGTVGKIKRGELYRNIGGRPSLSDFTDAEIAQEHHNRMMKKLGDPRVGVGVSLKTAIGG